MTTSHILTAPKFIFPIRIVQLVLGLLILGFCCYGVTDYAYNVVALMLFTSIATLIIVSYVLASTIKLHAFYNYWAILALDIFATFFWLISFALVASHVASLYTYSSSDLDTDTYCYAGYCVNLKRDAAPLVKRYYYYNGRTYKNVMAVATALGAVEFVLFAITLAFTGLALHRHRAGGGHSMPGSMEAGVVAPEHEAKPAELQPNQTQTQAPVPVYHQPNV